MSSLPIVFINSPSNTVTGCSSKIMDYKTPPVEVIDLVSIPITNENSSVECSSTMIDPKPATTEEIEPVSFIDNENSSLNYFTVIDPKSIETTIQVIDSVNENTSVDISLEDVLRWPHTPVRKGKKQTERLPFVLTSTQWKKITNEKEQLKKEKELEKEQRKIKRMENKARKEADANLKSTKNMKKKVHINTKKIKRVVPKKITDQNDNIPDSADDVALENIDQVTVNTQSNTQKPASFQYNPSEDKIRSESSKLTQVTRKFFVGETQNKDVLLEIDNLVPEKVNILSNILLQVTTCGLDLNKNIKLVRGLCYSCVNNLNSSNFGIKCQFCNRAYHLKCIENFQLHKSNSDIFECVTCLKKKY